MRDTGRTIGAQARGAIGATLCSAAADTGRAGRPAVAARSAVTAVAGVAAAHGAVSARPAGGAGAGAGLDARVIALGLVWVGARVGAPVMLDGQEIGIYTSVCQEFALALIKRSADSSSIQIGS